MLTSRSLRMMVSNAMDAPTRAGTNVPKWKCHQLLEPKGASTMKITTVGIDLAKNVFQVRGIDERGKAVLKKQLRRDQMATFFVNLPPCLIGMETGSSDSERAPSRVPQSRHSGLGAGPVRTQPRCGRQDEISQWDQR